MTHEPDERDPSLDAAWHAQSNELPPAHLDAAILAAAHRAVGSSPRAAGSPEATRPWRWWAPLAAAAAIGAVAIGVMQLLPPEVGMMSGVTVDAPASAPSLAKQKAESQRATNSSLAAADASKATPAAPAAENESKRGLESRVGTEPGEGTRLHVPAKSDVRAQTGVPAPGASEQRNAMPSPPEDKVEGRSGGGATAPSRDQFVRGAPTQPGVDTEVQRRDEASSSNVLPATPNPFPATPGAPPAREPRDVGGTASNAPSVPDTPAIANAPARQSAPTSASSPAAARAPAAVPSPAAATPSAAPEPPAVASPAAPAPSRVPEPFPAMKPRGQSAAPATTSRPQSAPLTDRVGSADASEKLQAPLHKDARDAVTSRSEADLPAGSRIETRKGTLSSGNVTGPRNADEWIARIRALHRDGKDADAERELNAFRAAYPDADRRMPEDLRAWTATVKHS